MSNRSMTRRCSSNRARADSPPTRRRLRWESLLLVGLATACGRSVTEPATPAEHDCPGWIEQRQAERYCCTSTSGPGRGKRCTPLPPHRAPTADAN